MYSAVSWELLGTEFVACRRGRKVTVGLVSAGFVRAAIDFMHSYCFPDWSNAKRKKCRHPFFKMRLLSSRNKSLHFSVLVRVLM